MPSPSLFRYFTTPIYYANGSPHAGHIYATTLASILKLHYTHRGFETRFLTGLDEHGEAVQEKAKEKSLEPQNLVDQMAVEWKRVFADFKINYDVFLRTTSAEHVRNVQDILAHCHQKGDIYFGEHEGYYCVKCEGFLNSSERDENNCCLIHKRPTELRKEKNYFFKMSNYRAQLKELIAQKKIVAQERYVNELMSMLDNMEGDLSISRPKSRLTWGIELPFDKEHVAYVWFDALPNYVTGIGGFKAAHTSPFWHNAHHILGKDILKFHGIFWPAMCLSLGIAVPKLLVTGWLLKDGHKMSKSLGNVFSVADIAHYGKDMFVNYVFRVANPGEDIDISIKSYTDRYNADLANGVGNLLARTLTMVDKYCDGFLPQFDPKHVDATEQKPIAARVEEVFKVVEKAFDEFRIADALNEISTLVALADRHITRMKPWELAKKSDADTQALLKNVLAFSVALLRSVGFLSAAFFPQKMQELLTSLGEENAAPGEFFTHGRDFFAIRSGFKVTHIPKLFDRFEAVPAVNKAEKTMETQTPAAPAAPTDPIIQIQDFSKVILRVATVVRAEHVEGSDKLLRLIVSLGALGERQVFSGIKEWVKPEDIVNHKVIIVSNLAPRKMKFGMSEGMLLTAEGLNGEVCPVYLGENLVEGSILV